MSEEERTDQFATATLGLIGDFGETYKAQVRDVLMEEWVQSAIAYGRQRGASKQCRRNASYAQKVCPTVKQEQSIELTLCRRSVKSPHQDNFSMPRVL